MAYDAIEPIDAAGVILKGLSGDGDKQQPARSTSGWLNQKMQLLKYFNHFGKKKK